MYLNANLTTENTLPLNSHVPTQIPFSVILDLKLGTIEIYENLRCMNPGAVLFQ